MIKLQNDFTTPKQSKQLLQLGIPADSADCAIHTANYDNSIVVMSGGYTYSKWIKEVYGCQEVAPYLPCWSVGRLTEIIGLCAIFPPHGSTIWYHDEKDYIKSLVCKIEKHIEWFDFSKLEE